MFLLCQDFENEDLDDYQGEGMGKGSGISPEEYRGEPIVRTVFQWKMYYYRHVMLAKTCL